jgi:hypothetical protein
MGASVCAWGKDKKKDAEAAERAAAREARNGVGWNADGGEAPSDTTYEHEVAALTPAVSPSATPVASPHREPTTSQPVYSTSATPAVTDRGPEIEELRREIARLNELVSGLTDRAIGQGSKLAELEHEFRALSMAARTSVTQPEQVPEPSPAVIAEPASTQPAPGPAPARPEPVPTAPFTSPAAAAASAPRVTSPEPVQPVSAPAPHTAADFISVQAISYAMHGRLMAIDGVVESSAAATGIAQQQPLSKLTEAIKVVREAHRDAKLGQEAAERGGLHDAATYWAKLPGNPETPDDVGAHLEREFDAMVTGQLAGLAESLRSRAGDAGATATLTALLDATGLEDVTPRVGDKWDQGVQKSIGMVNGGRQHEIAEVQSSGYSYKGRVIKQPVVKVYSGGS